MGCCCSPSLLRLLFQLVRADFRDPMADAIVRVTNWLIMPLRKGAATHRQDRYGNRPRRAPVAAARTFILMALAGGGVGDVIVFLRITLLDLVGLVLRVYLFAMLLYWLTSFVSPGGYAPGVRLLSQVCEPILKPVRRMIPRIGQIDFFRALGIDRDRCAACAAALNIASYMPDITVNEAQHGAANRSVGRRGSPEKPARIASSRKIFFAFCAKHRLFSMLFSAPS